MLRRELPRWGIVALVIVYGGGAWAACTAATNPGDGQVEVCVVGGPSYAGEIFGAGSDDVVLSYMDIEAAARDAGPPVVPCVVEGTNGPKVVIELPTTVTAGALLSGDAEIIYTLHGATFGQRVSNTDIRAMHHEGTISSSVIDGGAPGDNQVIFEVEATNLGYSASWDPDGTGTDCDAADHARAADDGKALLAFLVPPLTEASAALKGEPSPAAPGVVVSVEVDGTSVGGFPRYPARQQVFNRDANMDGEMDADSGRRTLLAKSGANAVTVMADDGSTGTISPDARETLLISTAVPFPLDPQQLDIASVSVAVNSALAQSDGEGFSVEDNTGRRNDGDGAGSLLINTSGDFRDGDMLFWDANGNSKYDAGMEIDTVMDMTNGMAEADFGLDEVSAGTIIYVPNGKDPLRSGRIATTVSVEYSLSTNAVPRPKMASADLSYAGAADALLAYAIAPPSNPDDSNIRVRCDQSTPCQVYFACDGADGKGYFGKMGDMIGARMVYTVNADALGDIIGADDADFTGRMSCEVIGSSISVQVLTRSGDALVNNTYVGGPLEAQVRDAINNAKAAAAAADSSQETAEMARCELVGLSVPFPTFTSADEGLANLQHFVDAGCSDESVLDAFRDLDLF